MNANAGNHFHRKRILGYLSGAPRVSTRPEAFLTGPRNHVLGVMQAFEYLGWKVVPYIVGDKMPLKVIMTSDDNLRGNIGKRAAADLIRLGMGFLNGWKAFREIGWVDWVYERFGAFQAMGWWFSHYGIPWILETNGLLFLESTKDRRTILLSRLARVSEAKAYQLCDVLVCTSSQLANLIVQEFKIDQSKVVVLPNGVNISVFDPSKHTPKRLFEQPTIGFVGSLQAWHGVGLLIEALAELRRENIDIKVVIVGDGPKFSEWKQLSRERGVEEWVHFVGRVSPMEVPSYIAGFDIGYAVQLARTNSEKYGSSLKLYEYAAMGKPVIASVDEYAMGLVVEGVTGYLLGTDSTEELVRLLRKAYTDRERWQMMGAKARQMVLENHSWEARGRELISRVESILEAKYGTPYPAWRHG